MSHYGYNFADYKVRVRPGYIRTDFDAWWRKQKACYRDGCSKTNVRVFHEGNWSQTVEKRFDKLYHNEKNKDAYDFLEYPDRYECNAVLVGITGWVAVRKVKRIVNHHVQEVEETKTYKTKPKTPLKGSTLYAVGKFILSFDARCYDPLEHGDYDVEDDC